MTFLQNNFWTTIFLPTVFWTQKVLIIPKYFWPKSFLTKARAPISRLVPLSLLAYGEEFKILLCHTSKLNVETLNCLVSHLNATTTTESGKKYLKTKLTFFFLDPKLMLNVEHKLFFLFLTWMWNKSKTIFMTQLELAKFQFKMSNYDVTTLFVCFPVVISCDINCYIW